MPVERSAMSIRAALAASAADEVSVFERDFRAALGAASADFDLSHVEKVLDRWVGAAHLRLNPPTEDERAIVAQVARGDFTGLATGPHGGR